MIIADITKANINTELSLIQQLLSLIKDDEVIYVFCLDNQKQNIEIVSKVSIIQTHDYLDTSILEDEIDEFIEQSTADSVAVYSFNREIINHQYKKPNRVKASHWGMLSQQKYSWPKNFIPLKDAINLVREVLEEDGAYGNESAIRASDLRNKLAFRDKRFEKTYPFSNTPGLITFLINESEKSGFLNKSLFGGDPNAHLWLKNKNKNKNLQDQKDKEPSVKAIENSLSGRYMKVLKENDLGPFSSIRATLFNNFLKLVEQKNEGTTVNELINKSIQLTREETEEHGVVHKSFPWRKVRVFFVKLLSRNEVLESNEGYFALSFSSLSSNIIGIKDAWVKILESDLIFSLIQNNMDIHVSDIPQLSGAIMSNKGGIHNRDDSVQDYVNSLIMLLITSNKVKEEYGKLVIFE